MIRPWWRNRHPPACTCAICEHERRGGKVSTCPQCRGDGAISITAPHVREVHRLCPTCQGAEKVTAESAHDYHQKRREEINRDRDRRRQVERLLGDIEETILREESRTQQPASSEETQQQPTGQPGSSQEELPQQQPAGQPPSTVPGTSEWARRRQQQVAREYSRQQSWHREGALDRLLRAVRPRPSRLLKNYWAGRHHLGDSDKRNNHQEYGCSRDLMTRYSRTSSCS